MSADIPIYGRLRNDTDGILASAEQIIDERSGRTLADIVAGGLGSENGMQPLDDSDIDDILSEI